MSTLKHWFGFAAVWLGLAMVTGCESTGGGSSSANVGVYYGVGFYDPWYYGGYNDQDIDIDINPPDRPDRPDRPVRPEQPIAQPRTSSQRSTPSIPSTPAPAFRGGGGGGGGRR
jgi:hypothetical protein